MAIIPLNIPDAVLPRVIDALCAHGGREEDSTVPKPQFAKAVLVAWVKDVVYAHEARIATEQARIAADKKARAEVVIT
jgi:small neutral amino acid transporter SnatA (MarC family)